MLHTIVQTNVNNNIAKQTGGEYFVMSRRIIVDHFEYSKSAYPLQRVEFHSLAERQNVTASFRVEYS